MQLRVLMAVTALLRSWNGYSAFERMLCLFPNTGGFLLPHTSDGQTFFIRVYRTEYRRLLGARHVESSVGIAFPRAGKWYFRLLSRGIRLGHDRTVSSFCSCPWSFFMLWHHCHPGNNVILLWLTHSLQNFAQHMRPLAGTVHSGTVLYPSVVVGEFGGVPLLENVSSILMLPRAGGHQLVHGPESKCS